MVASQMPGQGAGLPQGPNNRAHTLGLRGILNGELSGLFAAPTAVFLHSDTLNL